MNNLVGDVKANPKDFYRYIDSQKKDAQSIPPLKKRNGGSVAQSESEKAAEFNGQFTDVATKSDGFDPRPGRCVVSLSKRHLLPKSTGNTQE